MSGVFTRRRAIALALGVMALLIAGQVDAQRRSFRSTRIATPQDFDGRFQFCRLAFRSDFRGDGGDWSVDWPRADINLSIRLSELTRTDVSRHPDGEPNYLLVRATDETLFQCPFVMMTEVGSAFLDDMEAERLRLYMEKGGFVWADDFWGEDAWTWWEVQLHKIFPANEYEVVDLPKEHPIFRTQFDIKAGTPQIANIGHWARTGGGTSERFDSEEVHTRAVLDPHGNIMLLMTHNTDLGDSFEREADDPEYFYQMSVPGYAFGVNTLLYALTH